MNSRSDLDNWRLYLFDHGRLIVQQEIHHGDHELGHASHKIALIGNFLPRRCGIATFTTDLLAALTAESPRNQYYAVVMNDTPSGYAYPPQVRFEISEKHLPDYQLAADFLNVNQVNVVCLQHEFGIFGGAHGSHVLTLLRHLHMPIVATLHTVLTDPDPGQRAVLKEIADLSERLVVMSHRAECMVQDVYGIPAENRGDPARHSGRAVY